jgi:hypothetical protein
VVVLEYDTSSGQARELARDRSGLRFDQTTDLAWADRETAYVLVDNLVYQVKVGVDSGTPKR